MISGNLGLSLNILTVAVYSFGFSLLFMSLLINQLTERLVRFNAHSRQWLLWSAVTLPWFVSLASVALLILPELFGWQDSWLSAILHWHHIYQFHIFSWYGISLIMFTAVSASLSCFKLAKTLKTIRSMKQLHWFHKQTDLPDGCILIESDNVHAFASGLIRPRAYITRGLRDQLTNDETNIVQQHELAHARHGDPLRKYVFSLFSSVFPQPVAAFLRNSVSLTLEQLADNAVLNAVDDKTLISKTIIKVVRLHNNQKKTFAHSDNLCHFTSHPLELRIRYLLNNDKGRSFPRLLFAITALTIVTTSTFSVDLISHTFELLFTH